MSRRQDLAEDSDTIFSLTDTRDYRYLLTVMASDLEKTGISGAPLRDKDYLLLLKERRGKRKRKRNCKYGILFGWGYRKGGVG